MTVREVVNKAIRSSLDALRIDAFVRQPNHLYVPDYYGWSAHKQVDIRELPRFGTLSRETIERRQKGDESGSCSQIPTTAGNNWTHPLFPHQGNSPPASDRSGRFNRRLVWRR